MARIGDPVEWFDDETGEWAMGVLRSVNPHGRAGVFRVSGVVDPCSPESGGFGWSVWANDVRDESGPIVVPSPQQQLFESEVGG